MVSAMDIAIGPENSELLIGGTVVAFGTSLPELAAPVVAETRNGADIAVGNVIGSNIFNLTAVPGAAVVIKPLSIAPGVLGRPLPASSSSRRRFGPWPGWHSTRGAGKAFFLLVLYAVIRLRPEGST